MHLAAAFIQRDLQLHSGYTFFCQYDSLGTEPTTFSAANAMLYHWATGTPFLVSLSMRVLNNFLNDSL